MSIIHLCTSCHNGGPQWLWQNLFMTKFKAHFSSAVCSMLNGHWDKKYLSINWIVKNSNQSILCTTFWSLSFKYNSRCHSSFDFLPWISCAASSLRFPSFFGFYLYYLFQLNYDFTKLSSHDGRWGHFFFYTYLPFGLKGQFSHPGAALFHMYHAPVGPQRWVNQFSQITE